jgi:hypothetical protein
MNSTTEMGALTPPEHEAPCCEVCGSELEWIECWKCLGDAEFDLYEEDPLAYAPGQTEKCDECDGEGGWLGCCAKHDSQAT